MSKLYNLARQLSPTIGTGPIALGSAVHSFLSFDAAGAQDGDTITYALEEGDQREIGRGVYDKTAQTLTRSVLRSTNNNTPITLNGKAQIFVTAAAEDLIAPDNAIYGRCNGNWLPTVAMTEPTAPIPTGQLWFDATTDELKLRTNGSWATSTPTNRYLPLMGGALNTIEGPPPWYMNHPDFLGVFPNQAALNAIDTTGFDPWEAFVITRDTRRFFYWDGTSWEDSGPIAPDPLPEEFDGGLGLTITNNNQSLSSFLFGLTVNSSPLGLGVGGGISINSSGGGFGLDIYSTSSVEAIRVRSMGHQAISVFNFGDSITGAGWGLNVINLSGGVGVLSELTSTSSAVGLEIPRALAATGASVRLRASSSTMILPSNTMLGDIRFSSSFLYGQLLDNAIIRGISTQQASDIARGGRLEFLTTPNGTITPVTALTIDQDRSVVLATVTDTAGGLVIPVDDPSEARAGATINVTNGMGLHVNASGTYSMGMRIDSNSGDGYPALHVVNVGGDSALRVDDASASGAWAGVAFRSYGSGGRPLLLLEANTNAVSNPLLVINNLGTGDRIRAPGFVVAANGTVRLGAPTGPAVTGAGNINIAGDYYKNGVPLLSLPISLVNGGTGRDNSGGSVALGANALANVGAVAQSNWHVAIGLNALRNLVNGWNNTAVGNNALQNNTASANTAIGSAALSANTTGSDNVAVGHRSLQGNTTGSDNIAIGSEPLSGGTNVLNNVAIGNYALWEGNFTESVAIGQRSAQYYGEGAAPNFGHITSASRLVLIGHETRPRADGDSNEIVIGANVIGRGSNTVTFPDTATQLWCGGKELLAGTFLPLTGGTLTAIGSGGSGITIANNSATTSAAFNITNNGTNWTASGITVTNVADGNGIWLDNTVTGSVGIRLFNRGLYGLLCENYGSQAGIIANAHSTGPAIQAVSSATGNGLFVQHQSSTGLFIGSWGNITGTSFAIDIDADFYGGNAVAMRVTNGRQGFRLLTLPEDGTLELGATTGPAVTGLGNINIAGGYYVNGVAIGTVPAGGTQYQALIKGAGTAFGWADIGDVGNQCTSVGLGAPTADGAYEFTAVGYNALAAITSTGYGSTAIGSNALINYTGGGDGVTGIGIEALTNLVTGTNVIGIGGWAGVKFGSNSGGSTLLTSASSSIFIGWNTRPLVNNGSNEIIIGYDAWGRGSNTVTLGNDAITQLWCGGKELLAGTFLPLTGGTVSSDIQGVTLVIENKGLNYGCGAYIVNESTDDWAALIVGNINKRIGLKVNEGTLQVGGVPTAVYGDGNINIAGGYYVNGVALSTVPTGGTQYQALIKGTGTAFGWSNVGARSNFSTVIGDGSYTLTATGSNNTAVGALILTGGNGSDNTAVGYAALYGFASTSNNTAVGVEALANLDTNMNNNVGIGYKAAAELNFRPTNSVYIGANTTSSVYGVPRDNEIVVGANASGHGSNTVTLGNADANQFIGGQFARAIVNAVTGFGGSAALNSTGWGSTAFGQSALRSNTTGERNTALGVAALQNVTTGMQNTALGGDALNNNTASYNVAVGAWALGGNTTGTSLTAVGTQAGHSLQTSSRLTIVGAFAAIGPRGGGNLTSASNSIFIGDGTRANDNDETNQIVIGSGITGRGSNTVTFPDDITQLWCGGKELLAGTFLPLTGGTLIGTLDIHNGAAPWPYLNFSYDGSPTSFRFSTTPGSLGFSVFDGSTWVANPITINSLGNITFGSSVTGTVTGGSAATFTNNDWSSPTLNVVQQNLAAPAIRTTGGVSVDGAISSVATGGYNTLYVGNDWRPALRLDNIGGTSGQQANIEAAYLGVTAWTIGMNYESFAIARFDTLGVAIGNPLVIDRTSGTITLNSAVGTIIRTGGYCDFVIASDWVPRLTFDSQTAGGTSDINFQQAGIIRSVLRVDNNNVTIIRNDTSGTFIDTPLNVSLWTGTTTLTGLNLAGADVTLGDPDSGGTGYRCLRVPN